MPAMESRLTRSPVNCLSHCFAGLQVGVQTPQFLLPMSDRSDHRMTPGPSTMQVFDTAKRAPGGIKSLQASVFRSIDMAH